MSGRKSPAATATSVQVEQALMELATTLQSLSEKFDRRFEALEKKVEKVNRSTVKAARPVKVKDPNAPTKPLNNFMLFKNDTRSEVASRVPAGLESVEKTKWINTELTRMWNDESNGQKQRYTELSNTRMQEYKQKLEEYNSSLNNLGGNVHVEPDSGDEEEEAVAAPTSVKKTAAKKASTSAAPDATTSVPKKKVSPKKKVAPVPHLTESVDDDVNEVLDNSD
jgi:hypothetical protein